MIAAEYEELARMRLTTELQRAVRAAGVAERHEELSRIATQVMRTFHLRMARMHRQIQERHDAAAHMHLAHAERIQRWIELESPAVMPPMFMSAVADAVGSDMASIVLFGTDRVEALVASSDLRARAAQDLELTFGEGPASDAGRLRRLVYAGGSAIEDRWPNFGAGVAALGIHTVAAAPLHVSSICLGALTIFDPWHPLREERRASLLTLADALTHSVLLSPDTDDLHEQLPGMPLLAESESRSIVHEATSVIATQSECALADALAMLRARAFAEDEPVTAIAERVVRNELQL